MYTLMPFYKNLMNLDIQGYFDLNDQTLKLTYKWQPKYSGLDAATKSHSNILARKDELWKTTCFEAFVKLKDSDSYFEVNVSTKGEWNIYRFKSLRFPEVPEKWEGAELIKFDFEPGRLTAVFNFPFPKDVKINVGLCAVIDFIDGRKNYYSLKHGKTNPDFHDFQSFLIERFS